jgi:uncharacterized membrane protein
MVIKIPTLTGGYMNIGDGMVLLCGFILGPVWGSLAAGIGSMLADLVGYPIYAIATFLIKALMAFVAYFLMKFLKAVFKKRHFVAYIVAGLAAAIAAYELLVGTGMVKNIRLSLYTMAEAFWCVLWCGLGISYAWLLLGILVFWVLLFAEMMISEMKLNIHTMWIW